MCAGEVREISVHGQTPCRAAGAAPAAAGTYCTPKSSEALSPSPMQATALSALPAAPALPQTPRTASTLQQTHRHLTHPHYLFQAFSGQLLPTVRGAHTILQRRKEDTEPSRQINHPVHEDNSPAERSSFQSHSPPGTWAPQLLQPSTAAQAGLGSHPAETEAIPKAPQPSLYFPTARARGFSKTSLKSLSVTFPPSMSFQASCQLLSPWSRGFTHPRHCWNITASPSQEQHLLSSSPL